MIHRSSAGRETWRRLLEWDGGHATAERLAAHILRMDGFESIDPSHPLGGPDGLKDVVCRRGKDKWIGAAHFPRGQQKFGQMRAKLAEDIQGVESNKALGIAFVTNQELTLGERAQLAESNADVALELYHLERVASILDSPPCYGLRLEFLDIEMTKEEQLSFMASRDAALTQMKDAMEAMTASLAEHLQERVGPTADIPTVAPREVGSAYYATGGFLRSEYVECKGCAGVYRVAGDLYYSSLSFLTGSFRVITCPYCGRTQKW